MPYLNLLVDDPYWKVTLTIGITLAALSAVHILMWLFGKRATLDDRERRRWRARVARRAVFPRS